MIASSENRPEPTLAMTSARTWRYMWCAYSGRRCACDRNRCVRQGDTDAETIDRRSRGQPRSTAGSKFAARPMPAAARRSLPDDVACQIEARFPHDNVAFAFRNPGRRGVACQRMAKHQPRLEGYLP